MPVGPAAVRPSGRQGDVGGGERGLLTSHGPAAEAGRGHVSLGDARWGRGRVRGLRPRAATRTPNSTVPREPANKWFTSPRPKGLH